MRGGDGIEGVFRIHHIKGLAAKPDAPCPEIFQHPDGALPDMNAIGSRGVV
ncbi:hypothetical protein SDC9_176957 [bioreactor metagenome]|uniref:Uncharacterized protein n=1 Tax=bioreactor metagenome TaxID=1076179 RepID=A0A645GZM2_9ZZZZ